MNTLNPTQLEILKLFRHDRPESELLEIKKILVAYLAKKALDEVD